MKICFLSEYPPIQSIVSNQTYWLARALGEKGVEVHIVTDTLARSFSEKDKIDFENRENLLNYQPANVFVHSLVKFQRRRAPNFQDSWQTIEQLANLGIEILKRYNCDLLDAFGGVPYGPAAWIAKLVFDKPLLLRWAENDQENWMPETLWEEIISFADGLMIPRSVLTEIQKRPKKIKDAQLFLTPNSEQSQTAFLGNPFSALKNGRKPDIDFDKWVNGYLEIYNKIIENHKSLSFFLKKLEYIIKRRLGLKYD